MEENNNWGQTSATADVISPLVEPTVDLNPKPTLTPNQNIPSTPSVPEAPIPVVKVLSVKGLEYLMMSISLWIGAGGLLWGILTILNGGTSFEILALPASMALVGITIFAVFFIRLKRAEIKDPGLRLDASKRRSSQITQLAAFLVMVFNLITFIYIVFSNLGGKSSTTTGKAALNLLIVSIIAGGILAYYWFDEHREHKQG
jgi:hypothetical protein